MLMGNYSEVLLCRSQKVAGTVQALMGGDEFYHYASKVGTVIAIMTNSSKKSAK